MSPTTVRAGMLVALAVACGGCAPTPSPVAEVPPRAQGPGAFFVKKGCNACHEVSSFGIPSVQRVGPDLATAVEDVPRRFGTSLEQFLERPQGTMALVLAARIHLDPGEKAEAIRLLHVAHEARMSKSDPLGLVASHVHRPLQGEKP